jgi:hypothetical protein
MNAMAEGVTRGSAIVLTAEEIAALGGAGPLAMALYLVLRTQMDFGSGLVGMACPISWHGLGFELRHEVPRGAGVQDVRPTKKMLEGARDALVRGGLIRRVGSADQLIFKLVFAKCGNVRPFQTGTSGGRGGGRGNPAPDKALRGEPGRAVLANRDNIRDLGLLLSTEAAVVVNRDRGAVDNSGAAMGNDVWMEAGMSKILRLLKEHGISAKPGDPEIRRWNDRGYTVEQVRKTIEKAIQRRQEARSTAPINVGFLGRILQDDFSGLGTRDLLMKRGKAVGLVPRPGESWEAFSRRVKAKENSDAGPQ